MLFRMPIWWSFILLMALAIGLAGCDSPSMKFQGMPATRIDVAGSTFSVRNTRYEAEAIGRGFQPGAQRRDIVFKGIVAIERVSGCAVKEKTVRGDTNLIAADLNCKGVPRLLELYKPKFMDCIGYPVGGPAGGHTEITCTSSP